MKVLANELGLKAEEATPDAFMKILELDPNALLKFKEFEMAYKVKILNGMRAVFHRPHPRKETDKGAVKSIMRFLLEAGFKPNPQTFFGQVNGSFVAPLA